MTLEEADTVIWVNVFLAADSQLILSNGQQSLQKQFLQPAGYITYDLKDTYDAWQSYAYWGIYISIS